MAMADRLLLTAKGGATTECGSDRLRRLLILLGDHDGDLRFMIPPFEQNPGAAAAVQDISGRGLHGTNVAAYGATEGHFIRGRMLSAMLDGTADCWNIPDNVLLSFGTGVADTPFSLGVAFCMDAENAANKNLIAKYGAAGTLEWRLFLDAAEKLNMELYDDNAAASRGRLYDTALAVNTWYVAIATYSGVGTDTPQTGVNIYLWEGAGETYMGAVDDTVLTAGAGPYVAMEQLAEAVIIGARNSAGYAEWFPGEVCMPFATARDLSATDVDGVTDAEKAIRLMVSLLEL